jgi:ABC-type multidrug transport system ATPase subunit
MTVYDPAKAHQYYLANRQLKGRRKGTSNYNAHLKRSPKFTVTLDGGRQVKLTSQQLAEERAYVAKRVGTIKDNLAKLSTKLNQLLQAARAKKAQTNKGPTAATKSQAARQSKKYRQQHQQQLATKRKTTSKKTQTQSTSSVDPVKELEHKIAGVKNHLHEVVARQRALASATKN